MTERGLPPGVGLAPPNRSAKLAVLKARSRAMASILAPFGWRPSRDVFPSPGFCPAPIQTDRVWQGLCAAWVAAMCCIGRSGWMRHASFGIALSSLLAVFAPASFASMSSITLAWDPSADPSVMGYNLYYWSSCRNDTNQVPAGAATSASAADLCSGATYYFAVTAYDASGQESPYSAEVSYAVPEPNPSPTIDPIADVTIGENAGLQTISLSGIIAGQTNDSETLSVTAISSRSEEHTPELK